MIYSALIYRNQSNRNTQSDVISFFCDSKHSIVPFFCFIIYMYILFLYFILYTILYTYIQFFSITTQVSYIQSISQERHMDAQSGLGF